MKVACKKDKARPFRRISCHRTRSNGFKIIEGRLRLDIRKEVSTMRVVKCWNRLP